MLREIICLLCLFNTLECIISWVECCY